jgi:hypothetical protein
MAWETNRKTPRYRHQYKQNGKAKTLHFTSGPETALIARWFEAHDMRPGIRDEDRENPLKVDADIFGYLEDTSTFAIAEMISLVTPDKATQGGLLAQLLRLEQRIAGPNPSSLELLLARRVTMAWAEANISDMLFYRLIKKDGGLDVSGSFMSWRNKANRRLLSCVKALAVVRKIETSWIEQQLSKLKVA